MAQLNIKSGSVKQLAPTAYVSIENDTVIETIISTMFTVLKISL